MQPDYTCDGEALWRERILFSSFLEPTYVLHFDCMEAVDEFLPDLSQVLGRFNHERAEQN